MTALLHPLAWLQRSMRARRWWLACCAALLSMPALAADTLRVLTEEYPPYNYTEQGKVIGVATEVVQAALKAAGLQGQIQPLPWARAYQVARETPEVLIYCIGRTPEREAAFKWVGVIAPTRYFLYAHPARKPHIASLQEAKALQIATVNEDLAEQFLVSQGFVKGKNLQSGGKHELNYDKLKHGRVDLWLMNEYTALYMARQAGDDPAQTLVSVLAVPGLGSEGYYMAFGSATPDALVSRVRAGLEAIKRQGLYEQLQRKWR